MYAPDLRSINSWHGLVTARPWRYSAEVPTHNPLLIVERGIGADGRTGAGVGLVTGAGSGSAMKTGLAGLGCVFIEPTLSMTWLIMSIAASKPIKGAIALNAKPVPILSLRPRPRIRSSAADSSRSPTWLAMAPALESAK